MNEVEFFVSRSVSHAKAMTMPDGITFLRGMLLISKGTSAEAPARAAYNAVTECDQQLELIAAGQLKFALPETKKGKR